MIRRLKYSARIGNIAVRTDIGGYVLEDAKTFPDGSSSPRSDTTGQPPIIQELADALWAMPGTRATTPHKKLTFSEQDYLARVDGRALPPGDVSGETPEVQTFHQSVYGYNGGEYEDAYNALQADIPVPAEPTEAERVEIKRGLVLKALEGAFNSRMWVNIQTADQAGTPCAIQFRNDDDWRNFDSKSLAALGKKLSDPLATVTYRTEDNEVRTFRAADFYDLAQAVEADKSALIYAYGDKRIAVNALATIAELDAYAVNEGWP